MTENLIVDRQTLFTEIVEAGREQGVADQEAFNALVENIIEDHRRVGEIHDDTEDLVPFLHGRFEDFKKELGIA